MIVSKAKSSHCKNGKEPQTLPIQKSFQLNKKNPRIETYTRTKVFFSILPRPDKVSENKKIHYYTRRILDKK